MASTSATKKSGPVTAKRMKPAEPAPPATKASRQAAPAATPRSSSAPRKAAAKVGKPAKAPSLPAAPAAPKPAKQKLVRDSFTIPRDEYQQLEALKQRLVTLMRPTKKSELLRAGIKLLASLADGPLHAAVEAVPSIKTGRPGKSKAS